MKYEGQDTRDPFVPLVGGAGGIKQGLYGVEDIDDITLEGVVYDPDSGSVVIANGMVLKEGAEVEQVKVLKIRESGVEFEIHGMMQFKPFDEKSEE